MKVSVIIPVYNCEKFIEEFIECLRQQAMEDYEAIFVDDCSTDRTPELLKEAVSGDERFHYYRNEERRGAANSRNRGINMASAPYVLCLDSDDVFEDDLLEQVTNAAYDNDADMVMLERGDINGFDLSTKRRAGKQFEDEKQLFAKSVFSVKDQPIDFFLRCENGTCDRMIRKALLDKYQIRFQSLKNSNDVFYILFSTFCAERIVHTKTFDNLYHRRIHSEPARISNQRDPMCAFQALLEVHDNLIKYDLWNTYCVYFWIFALDSLEKQLFVCKDENRQREVYQYLQSEGLVQLGVDVDDNYNRLPVEFREQYKKFAVQAFNEKCFQKSMVMEVLCQLYSEKVNGLAREVSGMKFAFWGVGRITSTFIDTYKKQGGVISFIIDNDIRKQGGEVSGCPIVSFESVCNEVEAILISNRHYYNDISEQILAKRQDIEILSLEEIIYA